MSNTMKLSAPKTLAAAAALSLAAFVAQAQENSFSEAAIQTGQDLTAASQGLYNLFQGQAVDGRAALTAFLDGTAQEVTEFYQDTTAQFALDFDLTHIENTFNGGLAVYAAAHCADIPSADDYKGQGFPPNVVIASFALQVSECLNALDKVTTPQGVEEILSLLANATGITISNEFKQNVRPIDQARMEAILFAVAYPHCVVNQEETACNIVRQSQQPKQP